MSNRKIKLYLLIILFTCASLVVFPWRSGETIEGLFPEGCLNQQLETRDPQSATCCPRPAICNLQLAVLGPQPTAHDPQPATSDLRDHKRPRSKDQLKIAVLPFANLSGQFGAGDQVMADILGALKEEFSIVPEIQVESVLAELRVRHTGFLTTGQINEIGKRLKVETILFGIIDTYRQEPLPQVSFFCNMVSTKRSAPVLWSKYFCAVGQEKLYLLQRENHTTWASIMKNVTEDLLRSLPKRKER
jgi:TolB-like protein